MAQTRAAALRATFYRLKIRAAESRLRAWSQLQACRRPSGERKEAERWR